MEKKIVIEFYFILFLKYIYIYFKYGNGENERPFEMNSSMRELKTSIEVQPKKKTRPLGLNMFEDKTLPKGAHLRERKRQFKCK